MNLLERYLKKHGRPLALLHRQSVDISDSGENQTGRQSIGEEPGGIAADADRPGSAGVGNPLDCGAQSAGQRAGGARIFDGTGPVGEGPAGGWSDDVGGSQPLPGNRVSAVGQRDDSRWCRPIADDAHRPLEKHHDLAAILSHVEKRRVNADYTFPLDAKIYRILRQDICAGLRGAYIRVEQRRDGSVAACFKRTLSQGGEMRAAAQGDAPKPAVTKTPRQPAQRSTWNQNFDLKKGPKVWQAAQGSGASARIRDDRRHGLRGGGAKAKFARYRETLRTTGR